MNEAQLLEGLQGESCWGKLSGHSQQLVSRVTTSLPSNPMCNIKSSMLSTFASRKQRLCYKTILYCRSKYIIIYT